MHFLDCWKPDQLGSSPTGCRFKSQTRQTLNSWCTYTDTFLFFFFLHFILAPEQCLNFLCRDHFKNSSNMVMYELKKCIQFITGEELWPFSVQAHTCCQAKVGRPDDTNVVLFVQWNLLFVLHLSFIQSLYLRALKSFGQVTSIIPVGLFV